MSLTIYRSLFTVPENMEYINGNDVFFNLHTDLKNTAEVQALLKKIDGVKYKDEKNVTVYTAANEGSTLGKSKLSTGIKTILNIMHHPDKCFSTIECGKNVLLEILKLTEGNVVWESSVIFADAPCDIIVDDEHYTSVKEAMHAVRYN